MQLVHRIPSFYFYTWCQFAASDRQYWIFASHSGFVGDYPVVHVDYCHCALILRVASKRSFVALGYHGWGSAPCSTFEAKTVSLTDKNFSCRRSGHKGRRAPEEQPEHCWKCALDRTCVCYASFFLNQTQSKLRLNARLI